MGTLPKSGGSRQKTSTTSGVSRGWGEAGGVGYGAIGSGVNADSSDNSERVDVVGESSRPLSLSEDRQMASKEDLPPGGRGAFSPIIATRVAQFVCRMVMGDIGPLIDGASTSQRLPLN